MYKCYIDQQEKIDNLVLFKKTEVEFFAKKLHFY